MQKLPKQWKHWCEKAGLHLYSGAYGVARRESAWFYLKGHGRVWRVNCYGMLQCGDTLQRFDRWALCDIAETTLPSTLQQFQIAVKTLLEVARGCDKEGWPEDLNVVLNIDYPLEPTEGSTKRRSTLKVSRKASH